MGEKVLAMLVFCVAYGLAITRVSEGQMPSICDQYKPMFAPCVPYLVNPDFGTLTPSCCAGAAQVIGRANNPPAIKNLCTCLVASVPNLGFYPQKLIQLPAACKIKPSFSMEKCVKG